MNDWDQRYNSEKYYYGKNPNDFLKENFQLIAPSGKVLCLAEGEGRNAVFLAKNGYEVCALDQSKVGLEKTKRLAFENKVELETIHEDLETVAFKENEWDGIISIWCHLPSVLRKKIHSKINFSLKKNGVFLLEAYTPNQIPLKTGGPKNVDLLMSKSDLEHELRDLKILEISEKRRWIHEGEGHLGDSEVVQFIGKSSEKK